MPVELPDLLVQAVRNRKCILFVGSGLSSMAGYPSWSELVGTLVQEAKKAPFARTKGLQEFEKQKDYLTLAEFARSTLGANQFASILQQQLGRRVSATEAHQVIANTDYRGLVTTNYDRILETTVTQVRHWLPNTFTLEAVSSMAMALYNPEFFIFKLHGDISIPESIVLTSHDYDRLILRNPHVRSFLQAIFLNYTLLFVGYSLRDPDFRLVLHELTMIFQGYIPKHYALIPNAGEFAAEHLMKQMNVQAIPYRPRKDHQELVRILDQLRNEAPLTEPAGADPGAGP